MSQEEEIDVESLLAKINSNFSDDLMQETSLKNNI